MQTIKVNASTIHQNDNLLKIIKEGAPKILVLSGYKIDDKGTITNPNKKKRK